MANPQNTPSDQDLNMTDNNPNIGRAADDMDAGAPEPIAYDEETDMLLETPAEDEGAEAANVERAENEGMTPNAMNYAGGTVREDTDSANTATPDARDGTPQGNSPSSTGLEGAGTREPGGAGLDTANSGLAGTENSPSNTGLEGQGVDEDEGTVPRDV